ncbi:MAG: pilus assembly FimT family protein, partial [Roseateles sp.]|uniref:pilus assembly FimT family protein n=1 Tax=Roseateles sp. TaxID=1971397 RepID=UPI004035D71F
MKHACVPQGNVINRGVGLIEILVAVAIVGVLLAAATPSLSDFMERRRVFAAAGDLSYLSACANSEANVIGAGVTV